MARSISFEKEELKRKLRSYGLEEVHIEAIAENFEKHNRHLDVINFTIDIERYGITRASITSFLKDLGVDDSTIINIFSKADFKRLGLGDRDITQVVLAE
jgi:hypothetical protein